MTTFDPCYGDCLASIAASLIGVLWSLPSSEKINTLLDLLIKEKQRDQKYKSIDNIPDAE